MSESLRRAWAAAETLEPVDGCQILLPAAARWDHPSWITDRPSMLETGVRILRLLTAAVIRQPPSGSPVHDQLASAWNVPKDGARLIRAALVLSADHEFNASAFAARVVASTGAIPVGVIRSTLSERSLEAMIDPASLLSSRPSATAGSVRSVVIITKHPRC